MLYFRMNAHLDFLVGTIYGTLSAVGNSSVPFESYIASGWEHMTNSYSKFTIAAVFTVLLHEVEIPILKHNAFCKAGMNTD